MPEYWTVGELAHRAGVTVRTIQFYDQQKLLAPSAKGPQNRRLYSEEDERELQRILVLKFLGNSLSDIRKVISHELDSEELEGLIDQQVEVLGHDLSRLMRRMAALRAIRRRVRQGDDPDWAEIAHTIDPSGSQPSALRHSQHESAGVGVVAAPDVGDGAQWRGIIVRALGLMAAGVRPDDPWARELASRYQALCERLGSHLPGEFIPLDGEPHGGSPLDAESVEELRHSVDEYLALAGASVEDAPVAVPAAGE